ncbi:hypothetical protein P154DRAFT_559656 [Amniculicola lignicola CBS 123094]|uniref:Uncharacterized protein n=1 Tax=Amniculicola lignicola CBS 123094 TaxID=1392246 RepID=A0A6A5X2N8_9PLEO|nr:hypothetical protein P154DRAFT_559656 [Amniculicola lignicola CBS 123094]
MPRHSETINDLIQAIDAHLAEQMQRQSNERPSSRGSMMVDWDGTGNPRISYRGQQSETVVSTRASVSVPAPAFTRYANGNSFLSNGDKRIRRKPLPTAHRARPNINRTRPDFPPTHPYTARPRTFTPPLPITDDNLQVRSRPISSPSSGSHSSNGHGSGHTTSRSTSSSTTQGLLGPGLDSETSFQHDYDGSAMHVHRKSRSRAYDSGYSEYYAPDAEGYCKGPHFHAVHTTAEDSRRSRNRHGDSEIEHQHQYQTTITTFIQRAVKKIEGLGVLKRFRVLAREQRDKMERMVERVGLEPSIQSDWESGPGPPVRVQPEMRTPIADGMDSRAWYAVHGSGVFGQYSIPDNLLAFWL